MFRFTPLVAAMAVTVSLSIASFAAADNLGVAQNFNGFVLGDMTSTGGDTVGRLAVGGNFTAASYGVNHGDGVGYSTSDSNDDVLVVGGNLNAIGDWAVKNGNAAYGTITASPSFAPSYHYAHQASPIDFAAAAADLQAKSTAWGALADANTAAEFKWGGLYITATDSTLNVINIDGSALASVNNIDITVPVGSTLLINVTGSTAGISNAGFSINGYAGGDVNFSGLLFNFYQATELSFSGVAVGGSVLAPFAHLTNSAGINGIGVVGSATTTNGEFHNFTFTGNLPPVPTTPVPEPATLALFALGGLMILRSHPRPRK